MIGRVDADDQRGAASSMMPSSSRFGSRDDTGVRRRTDLPRRDHRREELDAVGQREHHDVALADALRRERLGGVARELLELGAGD